MSSKIKSLHRRSIFLVSYKFFHFFSVIATRGCIEWLRKKRLSTQSLEDTSHTQLGKTTYSEYVIQENERTTAKTQREVAQKLLAKLREKERIVITLHSFSEMAHEEISGFLGTSVGMINRECAFRNENTPTLSTNLARFEAAPIFFSCSINGEPDCVETTRDFCNLWLQFFRHPTGEC